ncbi:hypothetical protein ACHAWF_003372 [Thalassiosira exigua]
MSPPPLPALFFVILLALDPRDVRVVASAAGGDRRGAGRGGGRRGGGGSPSCYRPTPGVEERWVAEEEFHGASSPPPPSSSSASSPKPSSDRPPLPRASSIPGPEDAGGGSWWDDEDEEEGGVEGGDDPNDPTRRSLHPSVDQRPRERRRHRLRVWKNRDLRKGRGGTSSSDGRSTSSSSEASHSARSDGTTSNADADGDGDGYDEEHPLRTDEWLLDVQIPLLASIEERELFPECWRRRRRPGEDGGEGEGTGRKERGPLGGRTGGPRRRRQVVQFARNGYVKVLRDVDADVRTGGATRGGIVDGPRIGKWRMGRGGGVAFDVPVVLPAARRTSTPAAGGKDDDRSKDVRTTTVLRYRCDVHLNKFGERPRMFRGVVTRDRHSSFLPPSFLRPVVGTFSAVGIGRDTADVSYRERAISLSRQQAMDDARGGRGP